MAMAFQRIRLLMRRSSCAIAGIGNFFLDRNGVDVRRVQLNRNLDARFAGAIHQRAEQVAAAIGAVLIENLIEGVEPFGHFLFTINLFTINFGILRKLEYGMNFVYSHLFPQPVIRTSMGSIDNPRMPLQHAGSMDQEDVCAATCSDA